MLAISESTGRDLVRLFDFPADRVTVIHLGVDRNRFFPLDEAGRAAARKRLAGCGIEGEYLLYVGTIEPRKNLERLLLAFDRVRRLGHREYRLVIAGRRGWLCEGFEKTLAGLPAAAREMIIRTEYFPKEGLTDLYNLATAFVYPSLYEGFGLPVLEAMACGCPVVTSNTSSLPELAGTAARLADPTEVESIAAAISDVLADPVERERMRREGFRQAERFSWEATARKTLAVYRDEAARQ
ncbi:MAG: D-inositol 3-phosphate glycosyltransferase [candidate division TA06 bacterium ADurb.Bin417]|uniref:D-inositol 3-phosphate glycosyltransferase n=1 Tax=candidate division TA06 bacterium ADurb.Bin417 TaxID=1852828 RepID=A0A1V5M5H9_UNCT6|nr:MAG: D-inositol 3-phosphate glycosyltransferase [candidate division TA06 bacterium ADurb.Bin417]